MWRETECSHSGFFPSKNKTASFCAPHTELVVTDLSPGPSTDSMIRVGGDYQAQIPEFKPGKMGGGVQIEVSGEPMVHVMRNKRGKLDLLAYLNFGKTTAAFTLCFPRRKLKSQLLIRKRAVVGILRQH